MSKKAPSIAFLVGLFLAAAPGVAYAGSVTVEEVTMKSPESGNSWWAPVIFLGDTGEEVDHLQVEITAGSQEFVSGEGIGRFVNDGGTWAEKYNSGTVAIAEGTADLSFGMALHFDGDYATDDITFVAEWYKSDQTLHRSITWSWDADGGAAGAGQWVGTVNTTSQMGGFNNPVPEPATLVLFGLGAAGLAWQRRRSHVARRTA